MAGDWIKMRGELFSHPRFLSLCSALIYDEERTGMLLYICGEDALGIGVMPPLNTTVTERALRIVTMSALRDVTMSALLRVWCAVNSHCKVDGNDAVMQPMALHDLDRIAGFDGFGEAIAEVGWVKERGRNSLVFPNFLEFNEPSCLRKPAKTNAERQREFRAKKAAEQPVTKSNGCNDREEKRREEKKDPLTPVARGACAHFEAVFGAYPAHRRTNLRAASKAWREIDPSITPAIVAGIEAWVKSEEWRRDGGRWVPTLAKFLAGRMWESPPTGAKAELTIGEIEARMIERRRVAAEELQRIEEERRGQSN